MICIASPVRRSGTTLLQRLLCSSSNTIIYGETCANDINLMYNLFSGKQMMANQNGEWHDDQLDKVLNGEVNSWIPDLMPRSIDYLDGFKHQITSLLKTYSDVSLKYGKENWGVKLPEWNPAALKLMLDINSTVKIIYLSRNITDSLLSAQKMGMVLDQIEKEQFQNIHTQYSEFAKINLIGERVLHIDYNKLVADPTKFICELEEFTKAKDIDPEVLNYRIGDYT